MNIDEIDVDWKVHDSYVAFSTEVVRLALLSPTILAFLVILAGEKPNANAVSALLAPVGWSLYAGFFCMAMAVLFGLGHRYFAADYMTTLIEKRRGKNLANKRLLKIATGCIALAPAFLFLGSGCLLWAVLRVVTR